MAALSVLRTMLVASRRSIQAPGVKCSLALVPKNCTNVALRHMGGGPRTIPILPGKYEFTRLYDKVLYYVFLNVIPMTALIFTVNTVYGQSELIETPEDYEPKHWEYFRSPLQRFFARYVYRNPQQEYEMQMHCVNYEHERAKYRLLEKKVRRLMGERGDYKGWYYMPSNERHIYVAREDDVYTRDSDGRSA